MNNPLLNTIFLFIKVISLKPRPGEIIVAVAPTHLPVLTEYLYIQLGGVASFKLTGASVLTQVSVKNMQSKLLSKIKSLSLYCLCPALSCYMDIRGSQVI